MTIWFTGLPCSGKSTLAEALVEKLRVMGRKVELLDGDVVRTNLSKGLGFSREDRETNIRRVGFVCQLLSRNDVIAVAALISPFRCVRDEVRRSVAHFIEVYVKCPLEVCIERDVKGMYEKALRGEIKEFTGVSDPYEEPFEAEVTVQTDRDDIDTCLQQIIDALAQRGLIHPNGHLEGVRTVGTPTR